MNMTVKAANAVGARVHDLALGRIERNNDETEESL